MNDCQIIRLKELKKLIGLSPATIYRLEKQGEFPKKIKIGQRAVGWYLSDIKCWIETKQLEPILKQNAACRDKIQDIDIA